MSRAGDSAPHDAAARLRVLLVIDSLDHGGAERYVVDLAKTLRSTGHEVTVACSVAGPLAGELIEAGVSVEALLDRLVKRRFSLAFARALRRLVRARRFDVVHAHVYASTAAAAAALAGTRVRLVMTDHTEAPWRTLRHRAISRAAYRRAARVMAVSTAIERRLIRDFGVPAAKAAYIPNAVMPFDAGDRDVPLPPACDDGAVLVGRVARLVPEKGLDVFLRSAAVVAQHAPSARFLVVGQGPLAGELRGLAGALGIVDRVHFLGQRTDARALIARLDVLVVSSITDGAPLVNLEAMAAGTPIVASDCGGIPDQIRDGVDGLLVPPRDWRALARAILRLVDDRELARRLGDRARRRAAAEFSYRAMLARIEAGYRPGPARRAPPPRARRREPSTLAVSRSRDGPGRPARPQASSRSGLSSRKKLLWRPSLRSS